MAQLAAEAIQADLDGWIRRNAKPDFVTDAKSGPYPGDLASVLRAVEGKFSAAEIDAALADVGRAVDRVSFDKLLRVPGVDPSRLLGGGAGALARFRQTNALLIQSVPAQMAADVGAVLVDVDVRDLHVTEIGKILAERFGVSESKGEFWARDQTLKLYANVQEERQRAAGASRYEWEHSDDERVRGRPGGVWANNQSNHWVLGGTVQSWAQPPITNPKTGARNHPGQDFQCRCSAYPIFDEDGAEVTPPEPDGTTPIEEAQGLLELAAEPVPSLPPRVPQAAVPENLETLASKRARLEQLRAELSAAVVPPAPAVAAPIPVDEVLEAGRQYAAAERATAATLANHPHLDVLKQYTGDLFADLNKYLRGETEHLIPSPVVFERLKKLATELNTLLADAPKFVGTVERGLSLTAEQLAAYEVGSVVAQQGFTSTSALGDMAAEFAKEAVLTGRASVVMRIRQRSGVAIDSLSVNPNEAEVLLPAGTKLRVIYREIVENVTVLHLEEL